MGKTTERIDWAGYPAARRVLLGHVERVLTELGGCRRVHYGYLPSCRRPDKGRAVNFRFRVTWVFAGVLCTSAFFERRWEHRRIGAGELFLSGAGGWDVVDMAGGDCQALAILYYAHHTRLVFTEFRDGRVVGNPYYHTLFPGGEISRALLDVLDRLLNEPEAGRFSRVVPVCRALLEQLVLDVRRDDRSSVTSGDLLVSRMQTYMQLSFHLPINCSSVCSALHVNRTYASGLFHAKTGGAIKDYLANLRLEKAEWLLSCYDLTMEEVAEQCGFSGANYFVRVFRQTHGISPGAYRRRCRVSAGAPARDGQ